ncbi:MAG TPA: GtrA family protein [Povalibacter sp.]
MRPHDAGIHGASFIAISRHGAVTPMIRQFFHFAVVRAACAVLSYGCYLLLLLWFQYELAYVVSYLVGIGLAYVSSAFVFKEPLRRTSALVFPVVYVVQFVLGLVLLRFAVEALGIPEALALAFSVAVTLPLTFLMSRWAVRLG